MSRDNEHGGGAAHGQSLPDSLVTGQLQPERLRALLRHMNEAGEQSERARLILQLEDGELLVKPLTRCQLQERAFVVAQPLEGLRLRTQTQVFACEGALYELVRIDPSLRPAAPHELEPLFALYEQSDRIVMLAPLTDLDALLVGPHVNKDLDRGDGHPLGPETSLSGVLAELEFVLAPLRPPSDAGLRRGLVHGDLHRGNLLVPTGAEGEALLIDLDPILHSYAALNLAHLCIDEFVVGKGRMSELPGFHAQVLARLDPPDAQAFDYLVLVELFRMLVKRAFHRAHYNDDWESELLFLFEGYGVDTYLAAVRPASSR